MNRANILIVEDESLVAEEIGMLLRTLGYGVCGIADSAADAIEYVRAIRPDLVLLDLQIKGPLSGIDVARRLRDEFDVPFVFVTAHADTGTLNEAITTEPFGYLVKPFDRRALAATVATALRRRRAELQVERMERWLAATMSSIGDGVIATDRALRVSFMNPVAERLCGRSEADALGRPVGEILQISMRSGATLVSAIEDAILRGVIVALDECTLTTADGRTLAIDDTLAPIRDSTGAVSGIVIVFRDATRRLQHEQDLRELNASLEDRVKRRTLQLEAANRELATFSYSIAHDLRAPLRAISGFAARVAIEHSSGLAPEGHRLLEVVKENARRMSTMIDDYLRLSGLSHCALHRQKLSMTQLARTAWQTVTADLASPPPLYLSDLPSVYGDEALLRQVWVNLFSNAVKFTRNVSEPAVHVKASEHDNAVYYSVTDNGVGFNPAYVGQLFQVFNRLHAADEYEGNGVGLCIVQRILHRHEGDVKVEAAQGVGATVTFWLPAPASAAT